MATYNSTCKNTNVYSLLFQKEYTLRPNIAKLARMMEAKMLLRNSYQGGPIRIAEKQKSTFRVVLSKDNQFMATAHGSHSVLVFALIPKCRLRRELSGHTRSPWSLCFNPINSDILLSGSLKGILHLWSVKSDTPLLSIWDSRGGGSISSIEFHPLDPTLVMACLPKQIVLLSCQNNVLIELKIFYGQSANFRIALYCRFGDAIILARASMSVIVKLPSSKVYFKLTLHPSPSPQDSEIPESLICLEHNALIYGMNSVARTNNILFCSVFEESPLIKGISIQESTLGQVLIRVHLTSLPISLYLSQFEQLMLVSYLNRFQILFATEWNKGTSSCPQEQDVSTDVTQFITVNEAILLPPHCSGVALGTSTGDVWLMQAKYSYSL